jgi:hypothetical protein
MTRQTARVAGHTHAPAAAEVWIHALGAGHDTGAVHQIIWQRAAKARVDVVVSVDRVLCLALVAVRLARQALCRVRWYKVLKDAVQATRASAALRRAGTTGASRGGVPHEPGCVLAWIHAAQPRSRRDVVPAPIFL